MTAAKKQRQEPAEKARRKERAPTLTYDKMCEGAEKLVEATTAVETLLKKMRDEGHTEPLKFDGSAKIWDAATFASDWVHACTAAYNRADIARLAGVPESDLGQS